MFAADAFLKVAKLASRLGGVDYWELLKALGPDAYALARAAQEKGILRRVGPPGSVVYALGERGEELLGHCPEISAARIGGGLVRINIGGALSSTTALDASSLLSLAEKAAGALGLSRWRLYDCIKEAVRAVGPARRGLEKFL
ncbi:MAG: hypothetical protein TU35_002615 [Thermoproteus sp. AZ2]|uniref:Uncharacterized protein n=1 Tax=Thermoproteus sp. AZ2 TaxID=1609232 RepID=A0ACC6UZA2_9CREN